MVDDATISQAVAVLCDALPDADPATLAAAMAAVVNGQADSAPCGEHWALLCMHWPQGAQLSLVDRRVDDQPLPAALVEANHRLAAVALPPRDA